MHCTIWWSGTQESVSTRVEHNCCSPLRSIARTSSELRALALASRWNCGTPVSPPMLHNTSLSLVLRHKTRTKIGSVVASGLQWTSRFSFLPNKTLTASNVSPPPCVRLQPSSTSRARTAALTSACSSWGHSAPSRIRWHKCAPNSSPEGQTKSTPSTRTRSRCKSFRACCRLGLRPPVATRLLPCWNTHSTGITIVSRTTMAIARSYSLRLGATRKLS
mmetsp:Transcript_45201/g.131537  ORF Transcript_45201/g.131537 Transcript_45201/m.131537 type:complete len:219 (-) Transcript_45201:1216-1872(-)